MFADQATLDVSMFSCEQDSAATRAVAAANKVRTQLLSRYTVQEALIRRRAGRKRTSRLHTQLAI
jgi:hypothetical protein